MGRLTLKVSLQCVIENYSLPNGWRSEMTSPITQQASTITKPSTCIIFSSLVKSS